MSNREGRERNPRFAALMEELRLRQSPPSLNQLSHVTRLTNMMVGRLLDGYQPTWQSVYRIAQAYPDMAEVLFDAAGYPMPVDLVPVVAKVAKETGKSPQDIVDEAVRKLFDR